MEEVDVNGLMVLDVSGDIDCRFGGFMNDIGLEAQYLRGDFVNEINVIAPYKWEGVWVFDDAKAGLEKEPFVSGADDVLDLLSAHIPNSASGFLLTFSGKPFPGFQMFAEWRREEHEGNWYFVPAYGIEGWLCPALMRYFDYVPAKIFVKAEQKRFEVI
ncbi:MAG TPA: DUF6717 family protein [Chthoniobacterales bacterium]